MQDDAKQAKLASELMEALTVDEPGFIPVVAIIELVWVLTSSFALVRNQVVQALEVLLQTKEVQVENAEWCGGRGASIAPALPILQTV